MSRIKICNPFDQTALLLEEMSVAHLFLSFTITLRHYCLLNNLKDYGANLHKLAVHYVERFHHQLCIVLVSFLKLHLIKVLNTGPRFQHIYDLDFDISFDIESIDPDGRILYSCILLAAKLLFFKGLLEQSVGIKSLFLRKLGPDVIHPLVDCITNLLMHCDLDVLQVRINIRYDPLIGLNLFVDNAFMPFKIFKLSVESKFVVYVH